MRLTLYTFIALLPLSVSSCDSNIKKSISNNNCQNIIQLSSDDMIELGER